MDEGFATVDRLAEQLRTIHGETLTKVDGGFATVDRLAEQLRTTHGETLARMDTGFVAVEKVGADEVLALTRMDALLAGCFEQRGELLSRMDAGFAAVEKVGDQTLLKSFSHRLEEIANGFMGQLNALSEQVEQNHLLMDGLLQTLIVKVENAAHASEEGMSLLFGEMGKEMERVRRQVRESTGKVAVQTHEWMHKSGADGAEIVKTLVHGVSKEFKSALQTLSGERELLEQDREAALLERLLNQTAEQVEGVKVAVLEELDETAKRLATHMRTSDEEQMRQQEESAQEMVSVIAERMESAFGGVSAELAEMRKRLVAEQKAMEASLQAWVLEASKSTLAESKVLSQHIQEVQSHLDERHQGVIGVIDELGKGLGRELDELRDGLYHKNEESSRHVQEHLSELGQLLEGVVTSLGREQTVFIEMLGERLESLRRRLRVK
ncbi:MAG: hypothetical protein HQL93_08090 [Magnetococcales bacterium]|nr:hypothetical protein [Magnetococcales bacterium]